MNDRNRIISSEALHSEDNPNTVSLILRSLLDIQVAMIKTAGIIADENYNLYPLSETKNKVIGKQLNEIKCHLDKEMENISDLIFSLKEVIVSERSKA